MKPKPIKRLRWFIVWTLFCSTVINYINRQTLSVLAPVIMHQFHMTHEDYAYVVSAFQVAYAGMWLIGGVIIDIIGTRRGLTLAMIWWSISSMLHSLAGSMFSLAVFRFMLGIGEGFNWPGASKTVAEWFPAEERGLAVAIFDSGSSVGAVIAPPFVAFTAYEFGWRYSFVAAGLLGFLWLIPWLYFYHPFKTHPRLGEEERKFIEERRGTPTASVLKGASRWLSLLKERNVWGIVLGRSLTDPIWWFYVFWLPAYLSEVRGFSLKEIGAFAWIPFLAADLGNFTGGFLTGYFIKRGMPVVRSRKLVCILSSLPMIAGIPAAMAHNSYVALLLISFATWGYASWSTMGLTFPSDLFPQDVVASVTGLSGLGAGLVSTAFTLFIGFIVDKFSYFPAFVVAGTVPLLATAVILLMIRAPESSAKTAVAH